MKAAQLALVLAFVAIPALAAADGTKVYADKDSGCTVTLPASWTWEDGGTYGGGVSADKKVTLVVNAPAMPHAFGDFKAGAKAAHKTAKATTDTATELELESKIGNKSDLYRAIPDDESVCIAEVTFEASAASDARKIVRTLKPGKK
jgi:hypothetical protein